MQHLCDHLCDHEGANAIDRMSCKRGSWKRNVEGNNCVQKRNLLAKTMLQMLYTRMGAAHQNYFLKRSAAIWMGKATVRWSNYTSRRELKLYFITSFLHQRIDFIWPCAWCWHLLEKNETDFMWSIRKQQAFYIHKAHVVQQQAFLCTWRVYSIP